MVLYFKFLSLWYKISFTSTNFLNYGGIDLIFFLLLKGEIITKTFLKVKSKFFSNQNVPLILYPPFGREDFMKKKHKNLNYFVRHTSCPCTFEICPVGSVTSTGLIPPQTVISTTKRNYKVSHCPSVILSND